MIEVERLIEDAATKEHVAEQCKMVLKKIAPESKITEEKYGDMICKKLKMSVAFS